MATNQPNVSQSNSTVKLKTFWAASAILFIGAALFAIPTQAKAEHFVVDVPAHSEVDVPAHWAPGPDIWVPGWTEFNGYDYIVHPGHWAPGPMVWVPELDRFVPASGHWVSDVYVAPY